MRDASINTGMHCYPVSFPSSSPPSSLTFFLSSCILLTTSSSTIQHEDLSNWRERRREGRRRGKEREKRGGEGGGGEEREGNGQYCNKQNTPHVGYIILRPCRLALFTSLAVQKSRENLVHNLMCVTSR